MDTAHYGGPSPWGSSVDRSSASRFVATADHNRCATIVRAYQAFHMDQRGWQDIAYSSLVCPHGVRYEGRGLDVRTAAQGTTVGNDTSHATCYIAGDGDPLTDPAKAAYADEGRRLQGLKRGHRDWKPTACPGNPLYAWVHGGQPVPGPKPPPPVQEDDDMTILRFSTSGKPERLFVDGIVHGWTSNTDRTAVLAAFDKAGYKVASAVLTEQGYESLTRSAITGSDFKDIEDKLAAIAMYEAAQLEVETREEQRDLAEG
jgi:hypothetical protein